MNIETFIKFYGVNILLMTFPLVISGVFHMVIVTRNMFPMLKIPLSIPLFGKNKTLRGVIMVPICTVVGLYMTKILSDFIPISYLSSVLVNFQDSLYVGLVLGFFYVAFELPNSFLKRRLKIKEGELPSGVMAPVFMILDQADSVIGCLLVYRIFFDIPWSLLGWCLLFGTSVHLLVNFLLYAAGLRKRPC